LDRSHAQRFFCPIDGPLFETSCSGHFQQSCVRHPAICKEFQKEVFGFSLLRPSVLSEIVGLDRRLPNPNQCAFDHPVAEGRFQGCQVALG